MDARELVKFLREAAKWLEDLCARIGHHYVVIYFGAAPRRSGGHPFGPPGSFVVFSNWGHDPKLVYYLMTSCRGKPAKDRAQLDPLLWQGVQEGLGPGCRTGAGVWAIELVGKNGMVPPVDSSRADLRTGLDSATVWRDFYISRHPCIISHTLEYLFSDPRWEHTAEAFQIAFDTVPALPKLLFRLAQQGQGELYQFASSYSDWKPPANPPHPVETLELGFPAIIVLNNPLVTIQQNCQRCAQQASRESQGQPPPFGSKAAEQPPEEPDGPVPPDKFYYKGKPYGGLQNKPFRALQHLWEQKHWTAEGDEFAEHVYDDTNATVSDGAIRGWQDRLNDFFRKNQLPFRVLRSGRRLTLEKRPERSDDNNAHKHE